MVQCLCVTGEFSDQLIVFCCFCHKAVETIDFDDYVEDNILVICEDYNYDEICGQYLLCCGPLHSKNFLGDENMKSKCVREISYDEAIKIEPECAKIDWENKKYYLVGVFQITDLIGEADVSIKKRKRSDGEKYPEAMHHLENPIFTLDETEFNTDHDGVYLYYKGLCTECGRECQSKIWGD
jgi:hypothetical protein